jgi:diacylglycerol kinase (ATP)
MRNLIRGFRYAFAGLAYALVTQRNMRVHFFAAFVVIVACGLIDVTPLQTCVVVLSISLVIAFELANSALEHALDLLHRDHHPLAKAAKDMAAGAVFVAAANSVVVAFLVFYNKLFPIHWRYPASLLKPPFLGVFFVALLCLIVAVTAKAVRIRRHLHG